jgi:hypothetical protein
VHNQTEDICLKAVKQNRVALKYVNKLVFYNDIKELTIEEIENKL